MTDDTTIMHHGDGSVAWLTLPGLTQRYTPHGLATIVADHTAHYACINALLDAETARRQAAEARVKELERQMKRKGPRV